MFCCPMEVCVCMCAHCTRTCTPQYLVAKGLVPEDRLGWKRALYQMWCVRCVICE